MSTNAWVDWSLGQDLLSLLHIRQLCSIDEMTIFCTRGVGWGNIHILPPKLKVSKKSYILNIIFTVKKIKFIHFMAACRTKCLGCIVLSPHFMYGQYASWFSNI